MRPKRTALPLAALAAAAMVAVLAPEASALPLPLPAAGPESLVTEGLTVEGPLINNVSLPTLK